MVCGPRDPWNEWFVYRDVGPEKKTYFSSILLGGMGCKRWRARFIAYCNHEIVLECLPRQYNVVKGDFILV